jgi:hypothetical protein
MPDIKEENRLKVFLFKRALKIIFRPRRIRNGIRGT